MLVFAEEDPCAKPVKSPTERFKVVCYPHVGCFDDKPPFNNAHGSLPRSPTYLNVGLRLYTRQNPKTFQTLDYTNASSVASSHFDAKRPTKIVIHGFSSNGDEVWVIGIKDQLLIKDDFNVVTVDWKKGCPIPDYNQAVANLRLVGTQVYLLLNIMQGQGLLLKDVHMMGHSLGAHMSGYVGLLLGSRIGRISGMDPAEPDFQCLPTLIRLDKNDALFVDIIHTNGAEIMSGGAGMFQTCGHVDFFVNGGKTQPGCKDGIGGALSSLLHGGSLSTDVSCSHARSHDVFLESINTNCTFTAFPCDSYENYLKGECFDCGSTGCGSLGYYADTSYGTGKLYLRTNDGKPYCGYQYMLSVNISESGGKDTKGSLSMSLHGEYGDTDMQTITTDTNMKKGSTLNIVAAFRAEVGTVASVTVRYNRYGGNWIGWGKGERQVTIEGIRGVSGESGQIFDTCGEKVVHEDKTDHQTIAKTC